MYEILDNDYEDFEDDDNPGLGSEILLAEGSNPLAAKAMRKAGKLRREGLGASEALTEAWASVRRGKSNPEFEPSPFLVLLVAAGIFVAVYKWRKRVWPWEGLLGRRAMANRQLGRRSVGRPIPPLGNQGYQGAVGTSPAQLGRSFAPARPRTDAVSSHQLGIGPQSGASGQNWPRAV